MYAANLKNYKKIEIESAPPGKLLLMLYDGAIEFIFLSKEHMEKGNDQDAKHYIGRTQAIITELMSSLNMEAGEIAMNLFMLYEFMLSQLLEAYRDKSLAQLCTVGDLLAGLRESWSSVITKKSNVEESESEIVAKDSDMISSSVGSAVPKFASVYAKPSAPAAGISFTG